MLWVHLRQPMLQISPQMALHQSTRFKALQVAGDVRYTFPNLSWYLLSQQPVAGRRRNLACSRKDFHEIFCTISFQSTRLDLFKCIALFHEFFVRGMHWTDAEAYVGNYLKRTRALCFEDSCFVSLRSHADRL